MNLLDYFGRHVVERVITKLILIESSLNLAQFFIFQKMF